MNANKLFMIVIALCIASTAYATVDSTHGYVNLTEANTVFSNCMRVTIDNNTGAVGIKMNVDVDTEGYTTRSCLNGARWHFTYERNIYLRLPDVLVLGAVAAASGLNLGFGGMSTDPISNFISNERIYQGVFLGADGKAITTPQDFIRIKSTGILSPLSKINAHLRQDFSSTDLVSSQGIAFYEALYSQNPEGVSDAVLGSGLNLDANYKSGAMQWDVSKDLSDPIATILGKDVASVPLQSWMGAVGSACGTGNRCVRPTAMDDDLNTIQQPVFAFSDNLNYYYYPYYIKNVQVLVTGFQNSSSKTPLYSRSFVINPTSNMIKINGFEMYTLVPWYNPTLDLHIIDVPNLGTQLNYDQIITHVPSSVGYVVVNASTLVLPSSLYRDKSPIDLSYNEFILYAGDGDASTCNLISGYGTNFSMCNGTRYGGFRFNTTIGIYVSNSSTTMPPTQSNETDIINPPSSGGTGGDSNSDGSGGQSNINTGTGNGSSTTTVGWSSDNGEGAALQNQMIYYTGLQQSFQKNSALLVLQDIMQLVFEILLVIWTLAVFIITVWAFFLSVPNAYRKMLGEFKKLSERKYK